MNANLVISASVVLNSLLTFYRGRGETQFAVVCPSVTLPTNHIAESIFNKTLIQCIVLSYKLKTVIKSHFVRTHKHSTVDIKSGSGLNYDSFNSLPQVETQEIFSISETQATFKGEVIYDGGIEVSERGFYYSVSSLPDTSANKVVSGSGSGVFTSSVLDLFQGITYYVRAYAINNNGISYGKIKHFNMPGIPISEINNLKDPRDGQVYKTIQIGNQVWMAEDLAYLPEVYPGRRGYSSSLNSRCYVFGYEGYSEKEARLTKNFRTYGVLYNWPAAMLNVVPPGWHLPSDDEWKQLELFVGVEMEEVNILNCRGNSENIGGKLKEIGFEHWKSPNTGAADQFHLRLLPGGFYHNEGRFEKIKCMGAYWTATLNWCDSAYIRTVNNDSGGISRSLGNINNGYSIRCVKD